MNSFSDSCSSAYALPMDTRFVHYEILLQNIAQGKGEYLSVFGKMLHVPSMHQQTFANRVQRHYAHLSDINLSQGDVQVK